MIPTKIRSLIDQLTEKTLSGKITWTPTSRENEYQCTLASAIITTDSWSQNSGDVVDIRIFNSDGVIIDNVALTPISSGYQSLLDFYNTVKRTYLRTDETLDNLLNEITDL